MNEGANGLIEKAFTTNLLREFVNRFAKSMRPNLEIQFVPAERSEGLFNGSGI